MSEQWKPVWGFEDRYEISSEGTIRRLPFMQRYLLRTGKPAFRKVKPKIVATQKINSGYLIVHLCLNGIRKAALVHRLVALHFVDGFSTGLEVNHKNGKKTDNRALNLEWVTRTQNHNHAVESGLRPQAVRVRCPATGEVFPSITRAARARRTRARTVAQTWEKVA